jgi:hypothetical protein
MLKFSFKCPTQAIKVGEAKLDIYNKTAKEITG